MVVVSAVALSEKVPDPALRPHGFTLRVGDLLDLDETARDLVSAGYERVDQVEDRGQFAIRGGLLDLYPATEDRAVRVDLFGDEIESLRWFSTFTQRSLGDAERSRWPRRRSSPRSTASWPRSRRWRTRPIAPTSPSCCPSRTSARSSTSRPADAALIVAGEEDVAPALHDHWQDVTAAFHDADAHHLYEPPERIAAALEERARIRLSSIDQDQPFQFRAQTADIAARGLKEAEPELEKLVRSGYRTVVAFAGRGEGERAAYNLGRLKVDWLDAASNGTGSAEGRTLVFAHARLQTGSSPRSSSSP